MEKQKSKQLGVQATSVTTFIWPYHQWRSALDPGDVVVVLPIAPGMAKAAEVGQNSLGDAAENQVEPGEQQN